MFARLIKKSIPALWCALALVLAVLVGCGDTSVNAASAPNGAYHAEVMLTGGSGRASIASPTTVAIEDGEATVTIEWSSPHYDYMVVDGERCLPINSGGNSTFQIPVPVFDEPFDVVADTTAMSVPHEIEYQITVSGTLR